MSLIKKLLSKKSKNLEQNLQNFLSKISIFLKIEEKIQREFSKTRTIFILDCGDEPGVALEAFRLGIKFIFLKGNKKVIKKISEIGLKNKSSLYQKKLKILDLKNKINSFEQCKIWLSKKE